MNSLITSNGSLNPTEYAIQCDGIIKAAYS